MYAQGTPGQNQFVPPLPPAPEPVASAWSNGHLLIARRVGTVLPDRCIKCNQPAHGRRLRRNLAWHHPLVYIAIISPIIYVILAICLRKTAVLDVGICEKHQSKRRNAILIAWSTVTLAIIALLLSIPMESGLLACAGFAFLLAGIIYGGTQARLVSVEKMDEHFAWVKEIDPAYLATIPGLPTAPPALSPPPSR